MSCHDVQTLISSGLFCGWFWRLSYWRRQGGWRYNIYYCNSSQNLLFTAVLFQRPICEECEKVAGDLKCVKCECIFCQSCFDMVSQWGGLSHVMLVHLILNIVWPHLLRRYCYDNICQIMPNWFGRQVTQEFVGKVWSVWCACPRYFTLDTHTNETTCDKDSSLFQVHSVSKILRSHTTMPLEPNPLSHSEEVSELMFSVLVYLKQVLGNIATKWVIFCPQRSWKEHVNFKEISKCKCYFFKQTSVDSSNYLSIIECNQQTSLDQQINGLFICSIFC